MYIFDIIYKKNISEDNLEDLLDLFIFHMCNIFGDNYDMYFNIYQIIIKIPDKYKNDISITDINITNMKKDLEEFLQIEFAELYNLKLITIKNGAKM